MPRNEKAPAYQAYAADDLADAATMTREQFGIWSVLRAVAWRDIGVPTDPDELAVIMGVTPKAFARTWAIVGRQFERRTTTEGDRYVIPWMERQRERQAAQRERSAENGRNGGRPPKPSTNPPPNPPPNPNGTQTKPSGLAKPNPDESSSSFKLQVSGTTALHTPPPAPEAVARDGLRGRLRPEHHDDLDALLGRLNPDARLPWLRKLLGLLDAEACAAHNRRCHRPADVGEAIREFNANRGDNWRFFERHVEKLAPPTEVVAVATNGAHSANGANGHSPPRPTRTDRVVERSIQGTAAALAALKGRVR